LKRYEKESLLKNFIVFFILLETLLILLFLQRYHNFIQDYKENIYKDMEVCSYSMKCKKYKIDFTPKSKSKTNILYEENGLYSYFTIPKSKKFNIKLYYSQDSLKEDKDKIVKKIVINFVAMSILLFGVALFFTLYSLRPIREALQLNDEFVKDILHDFNTPISSMILNIEMLEPKERENFFIKRVEQAINSIILLQDNLKSFLNLSPTSNSNIDISKLLKERLEFISALYPNINFELIDKEPFTFYGNQDMLCRIFDNLLSNASKYNKPKGLVKAIIMENSISIIDTGKGISNIKKVFDRYYKEQDRGIGLGLHIVKKLSDELNINIEIESKLGEGTTVTLQFAIIS